MLFRLIKYFRGYVELSLWGYAPERFFNLCSNHNILLWDLQQDGDVYHFKISIEGFRLIRPLLKKSGTKIHIGKKNGFPFYIFRYRKRKLLFAGMLICVGILFLLSRFIWKIDINGNDSVTADSILDFLEEQDSGYGTYIADIDCPKLEEELRSAFDAVIWTSVKREGTTLTVDIQENLSTAEETEKAPEAAGFRDQDAQGYDLVALHDGTITDIYVRKGTPLVQKGDAVTKGTVLVSGALPIYNDNGELTDYQYCTADADIALRTGIPYKEEFAMRHEERIYSGSVTVRYGLQLFGSYLPLPGKKISYAQYTMTETRRQLRLCDSFYLPVCLIQRSYEEYEKKQAVYTKKGAEKKAQADFDEFLEKLAQKGVLILEKHVMIDAGKTKCVASGSITVQEKAFRYAPNRETAAEKTDEGDTGHESE